MLRFQTCVDKPSFEGEAPTDDARGRVFRINRLATGAAFAAGGGAPRSSAHMCEKALSETDVEKAFDICMAASENSKGLRTAADSASETV